MKVKYGFIGAVVLLLVLASGGAAQVNQFSVVVTPEKAILEPGQGLHFEAQLFDANGTAVAFGDFKWLVQPDSMGTISDDGFFIAGRTPGEARIIAVMSRGNVRYFGEAVVQIGRPDAPRVKVIVTPQESIVPPGNTQQYHVAAVAANNANFRFDHVRWVVEPHQLGEISQDGLFHAANRPGQGRIIAFVDVDNAVYHGAAHVTVSQRPSGAISGKVTDDQTGEPLIGAKVLVQRLPHDHIRWMKTVRTDSSGNYVAKPLIPGLYVVRANARDYLAEYYQDAAHLAEATPVQVAANDSITGIDLALGHGGNISGFIGTDPDAEPISHALVTAIHVVTKRKKHALTNDAGEYSLRSLAEGDYAVYAKAAGYKGEYYDDAQGLLNAQLIHVTPPDSVQNIDMLLAPTSAIAGRVVAADDAGTPIAKAKVTIYSLVSRRLHARFKTFTDKNGEYIASVPPGFYLVHVAAAGYQDEFYDNVTRYTEATPVQVFEGQHTTGIDFALDLLGAISGIVTDQTTGLPIVGARVFAFQERPIVTPTTDANSWRIKPPHARTDSTGHYRIKNLRSGKYFVEAVAQGYLPEFYKESPALAGATPVKVEVAQEADSIDFTLSPGGAIAGTVWDATNETPLAGAVVALWSLEKGVKRHVFTNNEGRYEFGGLPDGAYILFANMRGYDGKFYDGVDSREEATPVKIENGGKVDGIDFKLPKFNTHLGTIAGVVTAEPDPNDPATSTPIAGAFVLAIPISPGPAHFDVTDPFGNYRITNLIPGNYIVLAWAPHYIGEYYDNVLNWANATPVPAVANQVTDGIDFALAEASRGPYRIRGIVRRGRGQNRTAAGNAVVFAMNENGVVASTITEPSGEFVMDELPSGDYKLMVDGVGMKTAYYGGATDAEAQTISLANGTSGDNVEINAEDVTTGISENGMGVPEHFSLEQNYPNPFNPETTIKFNLAQKSHITLRIYNVLGQVVRTLVDKELEAGTYEMQWNGSDENGNRVASGVYLLRFTAGDVVQTRRMVLMK